MAFTTGISKFVVDFMNFTCKNSSLCVENLTYNLYRRDILIGPMHKKDKLFKLQCYELTHGRIPYSKSFLNPENYK